MWLRLSHALEAGEEAVVPGLYVLQVLQDVGAVCCRSRGGGGGTPGTS